MFCNAKMLLLKTNVMQALRETVKYHYISILYHTFYHPGQATMFSL